MNEGQIIRERVDSFKSFVAVFKKISGWVIYLCKHPFRLGDVQCLEWILTQYDVHENDGTKDKLQGIHWCCHHHDNLECLEVLIKHGVNINVRSGNRPEFHRKKAQDRAHWLPIEFAIACKANRCLRRLIEAGAQSWDEKVFRPPDWVGCYIKERNQLRQAALIILISQKRGVLRGQDRFLVKIIGQLVWQLRLN